MYERKDRTFIYNNIIVIEMYLLCFRSLTKERGAGVNFYTKSRERYSLVFLVEIIKFFIKYLTYVMSNMLTKG